MKKRKALICMVMALTMIFCLSVPTFATDISMTTSPEEELKAFVAENFGSMLTSILRFYEVDESSFSDFHLLEPITVNMTVEVDSPNVIFPVADGNGTVQYIYTVMTNRGYSASIAKAFAPLVNAVLNSGVEEAIFIQDEMDLYAVTGQGGFSLLHRASVDVVEKNDAVVLMSEFENQVLTTTALEENVTYTEIAQTSYLMEQNRLVVQNSTVEYPVLLENYPGVDQKVSGVTRDLCWAATVASMVRYEKPSLYGSLTARDVADYMGIDYDAGGSPAQVITALNHYLGSPYNPQRVMSSYTVSDVTTIIDNNDPAYVRFRYRPNILSAYQRHGVALMGYDLSNPNSPVIVVMDPNYVSILDGDANNDYQFCTQNIDGDWSLAYMSYSYTSYEGIRLYYSS